MERWHAYIDESYTSKTFCIGGFLARESVWGDVSRAWSERIAYENRRSIKKGFQPISRYHATYCAHLKKEFSEKNGWSIHRQIRLTKRLCEIIGSNAMAGFVAGGGLDDIRKHLAPGADD
jgi:hypothetical protein